MTRVNFYYIPMTFKKIVELAAQEDATDSTATTATIASHEMRNKPTREEQTKAGDPEPFGDFMGDEFGLPYNQILFMTEKKLRNTEDRRVLDAYTNT